MGRNIHQLFNVAPKRRHRIVQLAVGSFIIGAMLGLALLILTPFFAAVGDTPSHLIQSVGGRRTGLA